MFYGEERTLTAEEVQKLKRCLSNDTGEQSAFDAYCLCLTIEALQQEIEEIKSKELMLHEMSLENGSLDMKLSGEPAKAFMAALIKLFKDNGGINFLETTALWSGDKYSISIINCNGKDTPGEKLNRLQQEIKDLNSQCDALADTVNMFSPYVIGKPEAEVVEDLKQLLALRKENDRLRARAARMREALLLIEPCIRLYRETAGGKDAELTLPEEAAISIATEAVSCTSTEYHNPADVEALQKIHTTLEWTVKSMPHFLALKQIRDCLSICDMATKNTPNAEVEYHNPADIEAIKLAREALTIVNDYALEQNAEPFYYNAVHEELAAIE